MQSRSQVSVSPNTESPELFCLSLSVSLSLFMAMASFLHSSPGAFLVVIGLVMAMMGSFLCPFADAARAFFVFGDSLVDNGNNNYLATTARADSPPYGIDYPTGRPTGRFSNGFNIPDFISRFFIFACFSVHFPFHYYANEVRFIS